MLEAFLVDTTSGDVAFGSPFAQKTNDTFTTSIVDFQVGATNSTTLDARFDNIDIDTSVPPGPSASVRGQYLARVDSTSIPVVAQAKPAQSITKSYGDVASVLLQQTSVQTRTVIYGYDGLNRLTSAQEFGATTNSYSYAYDWAGNRADGGTFAHGSATIAIRAMPTVRASHRSPLLPVTSSSLERYISVPTLVGGTALYSAF